MLLYSFFSTFLNFVSSTGATNLSDASKIGFVGVDLISNINKAILDKF
jgi:hypothetical protein